MDKKIAGLLGAVAALTSLPAAQAATQAPANPADVMRAESYADLLNPIPNAVAVLSAEDAALAAQGSAGEGTGKGVQVAQYHHHHHHHRYQRRVIVVPRRHRHHHHHHHHHSSGFGIIVR